MSITSSTYEKERTNHELEIRGSNPDTIPRDICPAQEQYATKERDDLRSDRTYRRKNRRRSTKNTRPDNPSNNQKSSWESAIDHIKVSSVKLSLASIQSHSIL